MKVLWFSNIELTDNQSKSTGTWLHTLSSSLVNRGSIQLSNITASAVKKTTRRDLRFINQWLVPDDTLRKNGLPSAKTIKEIERIVGEIQPDIIHIWGTEKYWGLLTARGYIKGNIILETQGLKFAIEKYFYSGLSFKDIIRCFGIAELLNPASSLTGQKISFKKWGRFEKEMLIKHLNISTQSSWVRAYVGNVNPEARKFNTSILLRKEFTEAPKWEFGNCVPHQIFGFTSSFLSYKGFHILLDALVILKNRYPKVRLVLAGSISGHIRANGYAKWLKRKVTKLKLDQNVCWIGALDAKDLVAQMYMANVVVIPSFIESYCLALDEAMTVGVPVVASFSGAMPELAMSGKTALFFPPGDTVMCAYAIERLFEDAKFAADLSSNSYEARKNARRIDIAEQQVEIYNQCRLK